MARILIVDDEPDVLEFQKSFLSRRNHEVAVASSTKEALAAAGKMLPEVVFCDVRIDTDGAGFEILEGIKKVSPATVVYLITGLLDGETESRGMSLGAKEVLTKPIPNETLVIKISEALQR